MPVPGKRVCKAIYLFAWLKRIDRAAVDLGKGKRMLVKGGKLERAYQITVPGNLDAVQ
jgi:hypothetical protein